MQRTTLHVINYEKNRRYTNERTLKAVSLSAAPEINLRNGESYKEDKRPKWSHNIQFLMCCIAMSIGLGNIWRFPFKAYENGGGAFLIPYILMMIFVGRPIYYLEMILGQFSSRGVIRSFAEMAPAFIGLGYGQIFATICISTYYCTISAITLFYLGNSFRTVLPWYYCDENASWENVCYDSALGGKYTNTTNRTSSAELYFFTNVIKEKPNINFGIGVPDINLLFCLLAVWIIIFFMTIKGIRSTGCISYFLALFPYFVLIIIFVRAVTLPGAIKGIIVLLNPNWEQIFDVKVWFAAVAQVMFSLNICFGTITMYSSYNDFHHNINRDSMIIIIVDILTSILSSITVFSILGYLATETGQEIPNIIKTYSGLVFISYPEFLARTTFSPKIFSILFFAMFLVLGLGCVVAYVNNIITAIRDENMKIKEWHVSAIVCILCFSIGLIYITPGGQFLLALVDHYGGNFLILILAILECILICWIYGLHNFCDDVEFMLGEKINDFWKFCWGVLAPVFLIALFTYSIISATEIIYKDIEFPFSAYAAGWTILIFGSIQLPLWMCIKLFCIKENKFRKGFKPSPEWGPKNPRVRMLWSNSKSSAKARRRTTVIVFITFEAENYQVITVLASMPADISPIQDKFLKSFY